MHDIGISIIVQLHRINAAIKTFSVFLAADVFVAQLRRSKKEELKGPDLPGFELRSTNQKKSFISHIMCNHFTDW